MIAIREEGVYVLDCMHIRWYTDSKIDLSLSLPLPQDLVLQCWHQDPRQRLPFSTINEVLIKLSRKKTPISRSPSFPISLSRSSESLNFLK